MGCAMRLNEAVQIVLFELCVEFDNVQELMRIEGHEHEKKVPPPNKDIGDFLASDANAEDD